MSLNWPYFVGVLFAGLILLYKYKIVSPKDVSKLGIAFYRINAYVSSIVFIGTLIAVLIQMNDLKEKAPVIVGITGASGIELATATIDLILSLNENTQSFSQNSSIVP